MNSEIFVRSTALAGLALAAAFSLAACNTTTASSSADAADEEAVETASAATDDATESAEAAATGSIVETLGAAGSFSVLLQTLEAAGLTGTLSGDGTYTLFAPTDEAFAALPPGTIDALLLPENKDRLTQILSYHVVAGEELTSAGLAGQSVTVATLEGRSVEISGANGIKVDAGTVIAPDVEASNGIIQVIDTVLIP